MVCVCEFTALIPEMLNVLKIMSYNITHVVFMPQIGRTKNNAKPHNTFKSINITEVVEVCQKHTLHCQNDSDWLERVEMPQNRAHPCHTNVNVVRPWMKQRAKPAFDTTNGTKWVPIYIRNIRTNVPVRAGNIEFIVRHRPSVVGASLCLVFYSETRNKISKKNSACE